MPKMSFKKYWIEKSNYSLNVDVLENLKESIHIFPEFRREIVKVDDNHATVKVNVNIQQTDIVPFSIDVTICGLFECENWENTDIGHEFIFITSVQALFPYLRQAVSTITGMSNVPQYVLPIVNVRTLFDPKQK